MNIGNFMCYFLTARNFYIFFQVIEKGDKLATTQTINQINNLLRKFGQNIPPSVFETILLSLNPQQWELLLPFVSSL
jgi:hypothetical protein